MVSKSCSTLSDLRDCSPRGSSIHGVSQQGHWRACRSFLRASSLEGDPRLRPTSPASPVQAGSFFAAAPPGKSLDEWRDIGKCSSSLSTPLRVASLVLSAPCVQTPPRGEERQARTQLKTPQSSGLTVRATPNPETGPASLPLRDSDLLSFMQVMGFFLLTVSLKCFHPFIFYLWGLAFILIS